MVIPLIIVALVGAMGLYAALRPADYARYFLAAWQRERISDNLRGLSLTGWVIFAGCLVAIVAFSLRSVISPYGAFLEAGMLLVFTFAWAWWGVSLLSKSDSFLRRANVRLPTWLVKAFGLFLVLGAFAFAYEFTAKVRFLLR